MTKLNPKFVYEDRTGDQPFEDWIQKRYGKGMSELIEEMERLHQWQGRRRRDIAGASERHRDRRIDFKRRG